MSRRIAELIRIAVSMVLVLALNPAVAQDARQLYESAELEFQKGNYTSALSYLQQIETSIGAKTPRVHALKTKVLDSDGKILEAKLAIEEFLRMANHSTRSSEGYEDMHALRAKIDRAVRELERRWPQEIQKRRMEEADRIVQEQEAERERKVMAMSAAVSQFEAREWQAATQENYADGYKSFVERYPNSSRAKEARSRAEAASFREAEVENTVDAYRTFLEEYPKSIFALKAQDRYEELLYLDVVQQQTPEAYRSYLTAFPRGRYAHQIGQRLASLQEDDIYAAAAKEAHGTLQRYYAYLRYLRAYPQGKHADEASRETSVGRVAVPPATGEPAWLEHYDRGVEAMERGEFEAAAARFLRATELREREGQNITLPDGRRADYFPHRELGICLGKLGIADFAREVLQLSLSSGWTLRAQQALDALGK
jgi:outer membrane protein assembly factor BamD (BamD/ComL family)